MQHRKQNAERIINLQAEQWACIYICCFFSLYEYQSPDMTTNTTWMPSLVQWLRRNPFWQLLHRMCSKLVLETSKRSMLISLWSKKPLSLCVAHTQESHYAYIFFVHLPIHDDDERACFTELDDTDLTGAWVAACAKCIEQELRGWSQQAAYISKQKINEWMHVGNCIKHHMRLFAYRVVNGVQDWMIKHVQIDGFVKYWKGHLHHKVIH